MKQNFPVIFFQIIRNFLVYAIQTFNFNSV